MIQIVIFFFSPIGLEWRILMAVFSELGSPEHPVRKRRSNLLLPVFTCTRGQRGDKRTYPICSGLAFLPAQ